MGNFMWAKNTPHYWLGKFDIHSHVADMNRCGFACDPFERHIMKFQFESL